jgi:acetyltransferase
MDDHYLSTLLNPRSIVVFAGKNSADAAANQDAAANVQPDNELAATVVANLKEGGYQGTVTYQDINSSSTLADFTQAHADLALIALPAEHVNLALEAAGHISCRAAVILTCGIDANQAKQLHAIAKQYGMLLLGPNCLGFQRPRQKLNVGTLGPLAEVGNLGLISQSGALTSSMLDWAQQNAVGFSAVVSLGANSILDIADVLDFLATDRTTHSIVIYLEGIRSSRRFMSALRAAATSKPVVVLKAGRRPQGSKAALTHSGQIVGSDEVFNAALRRAGAVRVNTFVQLFSAAKCLSGRYRPVGRHLAIITNGGGPGVLAADWACDLGLTVAKLTDAHEQALMRRIPGLGSLESLIDLGESAGPDVYGSALSICAEDSHVDGILVLYSPKMGGKPFEIAEEIAKLSKKINKPLITCWLGDATVGDARQLLNDAGLPTFRTPEAAVDAFNNIARFYQNQQLLLQTPPPLSQANKPDLEGARLLIESVLAERRKVLTEMESKALLAAFHIPVTRTILARSANEAILIANQLGYPVALKIDSPDISHKSDVQGVMLNVRNAAGVRDGFEAIKNRVKLLAPKAKINGVTIQNMASKPQGRELYIGLVSDEAFGPVISFGSGGTMIELIADRAVELPPLNQFLAHRLIERVRASGMLGEWRGSAAVNMDALEHMLLRVSEMVCELPQLKEMDINPVIFDADGGLVVDARIVIDHTHPTNNHYNHLAILPYPSDYEQEWPMRGGERYVIRPIHPDDASMLQTFVRGLSAESRYFRFVSAMSELPERMLARFTLIDYDREMALTAVYRERTHHADGTVTETERIIGVSRYITNPDSTSCEFSLVVADDFAGQGLGSRLMLSIMDVARSRGLTEIDGLVLTNNAGMLRLMRSLGFAVKPYADDPDFRFVSRSL